MQLLIQRGQRVTAFLRRPIFKLWVKFEVTPEEAGLINQYQVENMILTEGGLAGQLKIFLMNMAGGQLRLAFYLAVVIALIYWTVTSSLATALLVLIFGTFFIYSQIREQVKVHDILVGRNFSCKSVVDLMLMEEDIVKVADCFRYLLEMMKKWDSREIIELKPYQEPVLKVIEKAHANP